MEGSWEDWEHGELAGTVLRAFVGMGMLEEDWEWCGDWDRLTGLGALEELVALEGLVTLG